MPGLPLVVVAHPLADNSPPDVQRKAEAVVDEIVSILTGAPQVLAALYRTRYVRLAERRLTPPATCTDEVCIDDPTSKR